MNLLIERVYCPMCRIVAEVVRDIDVEIVKCPHCDSKTEPASGDEV